jgi:hypothetical protein
LRASLNGNTRWGASFACRETCLDQCRHLRGYGFNFLIASNYRFSTGEVFDFSGMLEACDETGMLYSFTLPHISEFDFKLDDPAVAARYREVCRKVIRRVRNHPSVINYAMNHNCTGYSSDQNPLAIGLKDEPDLVKPNRDQARLAQKIVQDLDPARPVYHHESGNLGQFHTLNCYLNWAPVQERDDWLEDWCRRGAKPLIFVEWGLPHIASWSSCRGPGFIWADAALQSVWMSEYAAIFRGDAAYDASAEGAELLRREQALWEKGEPFRFGPLCALIRRQRENYLGIQALYAESNIRSFRGWGVSGVLPWDQEGFFIRDHWDARPNAEAWKGVKRPGVIPDAFPVSWPDPVHYRPTPVGEALTRWLADECAWIAGADDVSFTDKRHLYRPGEQVRKTLMIVNDRRVDQTVRWTYSLRGAPESTTSGCVTVKAGGRARVPVSVRLPASGHHILEASFLFDGNVRRTDEFAVTALEQAPVSIGEIDLLDTKGLTVEHFNRLGIRYARLNDGTRVDDVRRLLVIGRESLTEGLFQTNVMPFVRAGGRVVVFEQDKEALESIGFRVTEYGLRQCFRRYRDTLLPLRSDATLRDWSGESTLLAPYSRNGDGVTVVKEKPATWAGMRTSRVWRCRNRGAVATVLPEKPSRGDWRAHVDGGFDLQYAPLLEWRTGKGSVIFCQLDVTARTDADPAADDVTRALVASVPSSTEQTPVFLLQGGQPIPSDLLAAVRSGATALCAGFSAAEVKAVWPDAPVADVKEAVYGRIEQLPPELNGLSNADWAWHGTMDFAAFTDSVETGNSAIRVVRAGKGRFVFWQVPPWMIDDVRRPYLRTSRRRAEAAFSRLKANLGFVEESMSVQYADEPKITDDPFRYYRW